MVKLSAEQIKDSGYALALLCSIASFFFGNLYMVATIIVLIISMTIPSILKPFSYLWFGLSIILGNFMSKLIVSFVFFSIIIPVGFIIRLFKHNALFLNEFKNNKESMFIKRNHVFELNDIIHPF